MSRLFWDIVSSGLYAPGIFFTETLWKQHTVTPVNKLKMYVSFYRFFSPLGMVPVISLVGFGLFDRGFPVVRRKFSSKCWILCGHVHLTSIWNDWLQLNIYFWSSLSGWAMRRNRHSDVHLICCPLPGVWCC